VAKLQGAGDLQLLTALGRYQMGRVTLSAESRADQLPEPPSSGESLSALINSKNPTLFEELVEKYALRSGISGVQPKVVVPAFSDERTTVKTQGYIVKSWGDDYPQLAANEFFCMTLARKAGLEVPEFTLSDNGQLFVMKRFDRTETGAWLGFEDACVLRGLLPSDKYTGSYEKLAASVATYLSPAQRQRGLHQLFLSLLVSWAVRNGDAHLKNFGIVYDYPNGRRALAPGYDIVSTVPYLSRDVPALTLAGRKIWWPLPYLKTFGRVSCALSAREVQGACRTLAAALVEVAGQIADYRQRHPAFTEVGGTMETLFRQSAIELRTTEPEHN
jgi:serine/threonine-protein kinase HipA